MLVLWVPLLLLDGTLAAPQQSSWWSKAEYRESFNYRYAFQHSPEVTVSKSDGGLPASPCPELFSYGTERGEIVGLLHVPPPLDLFSTPGSHSVEVNVSFTVPVRLYYSEGQLEFREDLNSAAARLLGGSAEPLQYVVRFPTQNPLPTLTSLTLNQRTLCEHQPVSLVNEDRTTFYISHILYVHGHPRASRVPPLTIRQTHIPRPLSNRPPPTTRPLEVQEGCGEGLMSLNLIVGGTEVQRGQWPWLAALLYEQPQSEPEFKCGASLVSRRHVVTAGHCVRNVDAGSVLVMLGKHNIKNLDEEHGQTRGVLKIWLHPNYKKDEPHSDSDLAVLVLVTPVTFNSAVRPVCLAPSAEGSRIEGVKGSVVGWGLDENGNTGNVLKMVQNVPLVSQEQCRGSDISFYQYTSDVTFCAGQRDGSGPCNGDSGGGLYVPGGRRTDGSSHWMLRGVVSLSLKLDPGLNVCDPHKYAVFTDVAKFSTWIRGVMDTT